MITLRPIFSDNALFLHSAPLDILGNTEPKREVKAELIKNGEIFCSGSAFSADDGEFSVNITTPAASYDEYQLRVSAGDEAVEINGMLFGELWLASGQSNMEMFNWQQNEFPEMLEKIKGKKLRFFRLHREQIINDGDFPYEYDSSLGGVWALPEDIGNVSKVSACATAFSLKLYDFLNEKSDIPVGFLNSNKGAALIEPWLPRFSWENNEELCEYLRSMGRYPEPESWNKKEAQNFNQTGALFNRMIVPLFGARVRGIIWYQGEANCGSEYGKRIYGKLLSALRESYKSLFAASESETFPIISSMLYPWAYGASGETNLGYLNKAFSDLAKSSPEEYPFIPICDLKPIWGAHIDNHPIHPIHKYLVGERMGLLCLNSVYGRKVTNVQKLPPMLKSCVRHGNKLRLTFSNVGSGLYIKGSRPRGLYICGSNGVYTPAYCEIVSRSVMNVYHPYIEKPIHVAYAIASYEVETNLFAGEFPVAPFGTQMDPGDPRLTVFLKPWLNNENDSEFIPEQLPKFFRQPIYRPSENSFVCFDSDFSVTGRSIRVQRELEKPFGAYILPKLYSDIDIYNYSALRVKFFNTKGLTAKLAFDYAESNSIEQRINITGHPTEEKPARDGWHQYEFDLSALPKGYIKKMEFIFSLKDNDFGCVNIDDIVLVPKN